MKPDEPIIEIYVGDRVSRGPEIVRTCLRWAFGLFIGWAIVAAVYIMCMDLLPYALRML